MAQPHPRIVITGGGTAGHTNPGIAVAEALVRLGVDRAEILFVGGQRGNEGTLVPDAGFAIELLPGRGIQRRLTPANVAAAAGLGGGLARAVWMMIRRRPRVVLCLGGYAAFAVSFAAALTRVPIVVTEQNARASAVNRLIGRFAAVCALPFPDTDLPAGVLTGNPTLASVVDAVQRADQAGSRASLGLEPTAGRPARTVVAVWSGSLGARSVNRTVRALAERWATRDDVAIRHVIGRRDWQEMGTAPDGLDEEDVPGRLQYQLVEYETRMPLVLTAADVAVCRSGASTISELTIAGLPAILVPLPNAPRDHQRANTDELVAAGGAVVIPDGELDVDRLEAELEAIVGDPARRAAMRAAAATVARPDAADRVAALVLEHGDIEADSQAGPDQLPTDGRTGP